MTKEERDKIRYAIVLVFMFLSFSKNFSRTGFVVVSMLICFFFPFLLQIRKKIV